MIYRRLLPLTAALAAVFVSCQTKSYEDCQSDRIFGSWAVTNSTHSFGEYDSLYYVINPIGNIKDSIYYNGNYTDSYYHSDSTRVMLRYTTTDSIVFRLARMYAVEVNPKYLVMQISEKVDTTHKTCTLHLVKDSNNDQIYRCGPDSLFRELLEGGNMLHARATNASSTAEPAGSQNYEFLLPTKGFKQALTMADSLNDPEKFRQKTAKDTTKTQKSNKFKHRY